MSTRGSYSPRKLGTIIDMAHIIIGILIMVMACFAILRPARYMFLFPLIFFLASLLSFFNSWFLFAAYKRNSKKKAAGVIYACLGLLLFILTVISAISIWVKG
ncbi:MAG: hypothetical protein Q4P22_04110 [Eubacteriales bacterium]|nr:hypothetical protein [Eubacteriales bacterium]